MKNTYIFIDSEGSPIYSVSNFTEDTFYINGNTYGSYICVEYDGPIDIKDIVELYYYNGTEFLLKPTRPNFNYKWTHLNGWKDLRILQEVKDARYVYINKERGIANLTSFKYLGKDIAVDRLSRSDIDAIHGYITLKGNYPPDWPGGWKCVDNTYVSLETVEHWAAFYSAMVAQGTTNFAYSQALKAQVATATTIEEVESVIWVSP